MSVYLVSCHGCAVILSTTGGMIQNTGVPQQMILPQQQQQQPRAISLCQVNQPINLGQVGSQLQFGQPVNLGPVNPTLNFGQAGQPVALGQVNHTLNLSQVNQVIGSPGQIRFTAMPNFGFGTTGQLVGGAQTLLNLQVPIGMCCSLSFVSALSQLANYIFRSTYASIAGSQCPSVHMYIHLVCPSTRSFLIATYM